MVERFIRMKFAAAQVIPTEVGPHFRKYNIQMSPGQIVRAAGTKETITVSIIFVTTDATLEMYLVGAGSYELIRKSIAGRVIEQSYHNFDGDPQYLKLLEDFIGALATELKGYLLT